MSSGSFQTANGVSTSPASVSTIADPPTIPTNWDLTSTITASVDDQSVDAVTTVIVTATRPGTTVRVSTESSSSALSARPSLLATTSNLEASGFKTTRMTPSSRISGPTSSPHSPTASRQNSGHILAVALPLAMLLIIVTALASFLLLHRCPRQRRTDRMTLAEDKREGKRNTTRTELHGNSVTCEAPDSALHELASPISELAGDRPVFEESAQLADNSFQQGLKDAKIRWA